MKRLRFFVLLSEFVFILSFSVHMRERKEGDKNDGKEGNDAKEEEYIA
jgi:hypothetical protein